VSSNVSQTYPYSSESDEERAAAVAAAFEANEGLESKVADESKPLGHTPPGENGAPVKWWTWVCPACIEGRLHVAGYLHDRHGLYTLCDACGSTFAR
jgi:rubrerythrin